MEQRDPPTHNVFGGISQQSLGALVEEHHIAFLVRRDDSVGCAVDQLGQIPTCLRGSLFCSFALGLEHADPMAQFGYNLLASFLFVHASKPHRTSREGIRRRLCHAPTSPAVPIRTRKGQLHSSRSLSIFALLVLNSKYF